MNMHAALRNLHNRVCCFFFWKYEMKVPTAAFVLLFLSPLAGGISIVFPLREMRFR
jgi:hypothetical protein